MEEKEKYKKLEEIGRGACSVVYRGVHQVHGQVAIKEIKIKKLSDVTLINKEIHSIQHKHILYIYDTVVSIYLTQKYDTYVDLITVTCF